MRLEQTVHNAGPGLPSGVASLRANVCPCLGQTGLTEGLTGGFISWVFGAVVAGATGRLYPLTHHLLTCLWGTGCLAFHQAPVLASRDAALPPRTVAVFNWVCAESE